MSYNYSVGDKVACVDDKFHPLVYKLYNRLPEQGSTYVVREMRLGVALDCKTGEVSVTLVGLSNPTSEVAPFAERGFAAWRFVPLQEYKDVMAAVVEDIKRQVKEKELVEA